MIADHSTLSDREFLKLIRSGLMDPAVFSHEAHLRLAWLSVNQYGVDEACRIVSGIIRNYVQQWGAGDKYNATVTIAAVRAVNHFMLQSKMDGFQLFIDTYPQLLTRFKELIQSHYSFEIFNSELAKESYLEPDIQAF